MGRAHARGRLLCGGPVLARKGRWCCGAGLASIVSCTGARCECGVGACVCKWRCVCCAPRCRRGEGTVCLRGGFLDHQQRARGNLPFPELRPAAQGDPRGCGSRSHVAGGSEEFAYGIHRDGGGVWCWEGQGEPASFRQVSVCARRAWHIPGDSGWSLCGRTGLWRFQAPGEGSQAPVVLGIEIMSVLARPSSLK